MYSVENAIKLKNVIIKKLHRDSNKTTKIGKTGNLSIADLDFLFDICESIINSNGMKSINLEYFGSIQPVIKEFNLELIK